MLHSLLSRSGCSTCDCTVVCGVSNYRVPRQITTESQTARTRETICQCMRLKTKTDQGYSRSGFFSRLRSGAERFSKPPRSVKISASDKPLRSAPRHFPKKENRSAPHRNISKKKTLRTVPQSTRGYPLRSAPIHYIINRLSGFYDGAVYPTP